MSSRGYAVWTNSEGAPTEADTLTCSHCQRIVFLHSKPGEKEKDPGGFCRMCMRGVCGPCADLGACTPFEKRLEELERRGRLLTAVLGP